MKLRLPANTLVSKTKVQECLQSQRLELASGLSFVARDNLRGAEK